VSFGVQFSPGGKFRSVGGAKDGLPRLFFVSSEDGVVAHRNLEAD
jgi:hypothetical protein